MDDAADAPEVDGERGEARRHRHDRHDRPTDERVDALKERVYATFTGLAIVLVQHANVEHVEAPRAVVTLLVGIVAITTAGFVADVISHLAVHAAFPDRAEVGRMLRIAGSAIASAGVPLLLLGLAAFGVIQLEHALRAASIVYVATLGVIGFIAVRRTRIDWWKQVVALGALVALGLGVVVLQQLAHGH
ncbi:hypothetical protein ACFVTX_15220 [Agromyces sp. NPDC058136]|uniref:hypothetical protein n=1 Tax=Agromyces sp. NPDC058136 TaxID=3346354 RepID=UPI0036DCAA31